MKLFVVIFITLLIVPECFSAESAEWQSQVIVNGRFGDGPDEYGHSGFIRPGQEEPITLVTCFTVTSQGIYIFDAARSELKVYNTSGNYIKSLRFYRKSGPRKLPLSGLDIAVIGDDVHVLCGFPGRPVDPNVEWSRFQIFSYSLDTGENKGRHFIAIPDLGTIEITSADGRKHRSPVVGAVTLQRYGDAIYIVDDYEQKSFPFILKRNLVPHSDRNTISGRVIGGKFIRGRRPEGGVELLDQSGELIKMLTDSGGLRAVSPNSDLLAISYRHVIPGQLRFEIYNSQGSQIGYFIPPIRNWSPFRVLGHYQRFELRKDNSKAVFYELYLDRTGVHLIKWSGRNVSIKVRQFSFVIRLLSAPDPAC